MSPDAESSHRKIGCRLVEAVVLFGVLAGVILYCVRPWSAYFTSGLAWHWDTKLMGEWMAWNANNILQGHFLVPDFNANFFYPHAYTLAFSELLWPQSYVYAAIYAFSKNLFLSFNATLLVFWALSGVLMFVLLRELRLSRVVCYLGAVVYCLLPYRMHYYEEFNMQLVFVFPLLLLVFIRWLRRPSLGGALLFVAAFWVAATSCLYYTLMAGIMLALVLAAVMLHDRRWRNRRFFTGLGIMVAGVLAVCAVYLYPYAILHGRAGYQRTTADYLKHHAQPMHYLDTRSAVLARALFKTPPTRQSETFLFPGSALGILAITFLAAAVVGLVLRRRRFGRPECWLATAKAVSWGFFWGVVLCHALGFRVPGLRCLDRLLYPLSYLILVLYAVGLWCPERRGRNVQILCGLSAAAVLSFFISLGPLITVGPDSARVVLSRGPFADISRAVPIFSMVRGLTRFAIVILSYLLIAGCCALHQVVLRRARAVWLFLPLLGILGFEAVHALPYKFNRYDHLFKSRVICRSRALPENSVLFGLPADIRDIDSRLLMNTIGRFQYTVNGYSGFMPADFSRVLFWEKRGWQVEKISKWLYQIWPQVYILIDRHALRWVERGWHRPFPWHLLERDWKRLDCDDFYCLYTQRHAVFHAARITRRVRTDVLRKHPVFCFRCRLNAGFDSAGPFYFRVSLNGQEVRRAKVSPSWQRRRIPLPEGKMGRIQGEEIRLELIDTSGRVVSAAMRYPWQVRGISFVSGTGEGGHEEGA